MLARQNVLVAHGCTYLGSKQLATYKIDYIVNVILPTNYIKFIMTSLTCHWRNSIQAYSGSGGSGFLLEDFYSELTDG